MKLLNYIFTVILFIAKLKIEEIIMKPTAGKIKKNSSSKSKLTVFLVMLLLITAGSFYFYFRSTQNLKDEYNNGINIIQKLSSEKERCSSLLSQQSGNFNEYEYCRKLLEVFPQKD